MHPRILALVLVAGLSSVFAQQSEGPGDSLDLEEGEIVEVLPSERMTSPDTMTRPFRETYRYPNSFTVSGLHLAILSVEVMLERMLTAHSSVALIAGAGTLPTGFGLMNNSGVDLQEVGAQLRYYPRKPGLWNPHFGLEGFWGRIVHRMDPDAEGGWLARILDRELLAVGGGAFFGTKFVAKDGVTVEIQGGYQMIRLAIRDGESDYLPIPILNLNVGKSW